LGTKVGAGHLPAPFASGVYQPAKTAAKADFIATSAARLKPRPDTSPHVLLTPKSLHVPWLNA
jgi:hypothetical protein